MASVEYHRKVRDLIASMQDSERHRLELERKLIGYLKSTKRLERLQARRLMDYWRRLREDETRSRDRNERTLRRLEEAEAHAAVLAARTESLRLAKAQYEESVSRMYPGWRTIIARRTADERRRELERDDAYEGFRTYLLDGRLPAADGSNSSGVSPSQATARDSNESIAYPPPPSPQRAPQDVASRRHRHRDSDSHGAGGAAVRLEAAATTAEGSGGNGVGGRGGGVARWPQELGVTTTFAQEVADDSLKFVKARDGKPGCQSPLPQPVSYQHEALAKASQDSRGGRATVTVGDAAGASAASDDDDDEAASVGLGRSPGSAVGAAADAGARHVRRSSGAANSGDGSSSAAPSAVAARASQHKADAQSVREKRSINGSADAVSDLKSDAAVPSPEHESNEVRERRQLSGAAVSTSTSLGAAVAAKVESPKQALLPDSHVTVPSAKAAALDVGTAGEDRRLATGDRRDDSVVVEQRSHSAVALTDSWSYDETLSSTSDVAPPRSSTAAPTASGEAGPAAAAAGTVLQLPTLGEDLASDGDKSTSSVGSHDVSKTEPTRGGADGESAGAAAAGGGGAPAVAFDFGRTHVIEDRIGAHGSDPASGEDLAKSAAQNSTLSERSRDDDDDDANHAESFGSIAETDAYQSFLKGSLPLKPSEANEHESDTSSVDSVEAVERQMKSIYDKGTLTAAPSVDDPDADGKGSAAADEEEDERNDNNTAMGYSSATTAFKDTRRGASALGTTTDGASRAAQPISGAANSMQTATTATATSTGGNSTGTGATPRFSASIRIATLRGSDTESETEDHEHDAIRNSAAIKNSTPTLDDDDFDFYG